MELITSKEKYLRYINELNLGMIKTDEELGLLNELFTSITDEGFKEKEEKYIRYPFLQQRYETLKDNEKTSVINKIDIVCNGGNLNNLRYDASLRTVDWILANALAAYCVTNASDIEKRNIINFLTVYYSPYPQNSKFFSDAGFKALPKNVEIKSWDIDLLLDFLIDSFYKSINYLLRDGAYNPSPDNVFDHMLFQLTWKQRFKNELKDYLDRKEIESSGFTKKTGSKDKIFADKEEAGEFEQDKDLGNSEEEYEEPILKDDESELQNNDKKIEYLASKLNRTEKEYLKAWYKWYTKNTGKNPDEAKEKIIDSITSGTESTLDVMAPSDDRYLDFLTKELGLSSNDNNNAARIGMSRLKRTILELLKDPEFIEKMGISGFQKSKIARHSILKGVYKLRDKEMDESKMIEFISETKKFFVEDFSFNNKMINRISKILSISNDINLNESYNVETKDLDQEIFGLLKHITDSLYEAETILNELYKVHEDIKYEYPQVSEKIAELTSPIFDDLSNLISKVNHAKKEIKPAIYNLEEVKKKLDLEGDLEEERLTNPETKKMVKKRQNFIGSHIYGEDLGGLGQMYVAYSYGEQFPVYLWYKDKWYHNSDNYMLDDGSVNEPTIQHKADMRPSQDTHGMSTFALNSMIKKFKKKHGIGDNVHTDVEPGEKN